MAEVACAGSYRPFVSFGDLRHLCSSAPIQSASHVPARLLACLIADCACDPAELALVRSYGYGCIS